MRDNKPLELEAENLVCSKIAKLNLKYAKPNFDLGGGDLIIINQIDKEYFKSIKVQVKGRNITSNNAHVDIATDYLDKYFIFFLYLKENDSLEDNLYCFFYEEIVEWEIRSGKYYMNIPQNTIATRLFEKNRFNTQTANKLKHLLNDQKEKSIRENTEWNLTSLEDTVRLWNLTGSLPSSKLTLWFLKNINFNYSLLSHDIFLTCLAIIHSNVLQTDSGVDWMFINFKRNILTDGKISDIEVKDTFYSDWLVTYRKADVEILEVKYNNDVHNGLRLIFEDSEERIEALLIDNGEVNITYEDKM